MFHLKSLNKKKDCDVRRQKQKVVAIAAGGTGGHIFPAITIAKALVNEGCYVIFFTDKRLFNYLNKDDFLIKCETLEIVQLSAKNESRFAQIIMILKDLWKCKKIFHTHVSLCIGFGGFASFAPVLFSVLTFKKTIIHEQNSVMGLTNRILLPFVDRCLLAFQNTLRISSFFKKKCIFVGNPIRENVKKFVCYYDNPSVNYRAFFKISDVINLTITGGSQACDVFDKIIPEAISMLSESILKKICVNHQCRDTNREMLEKFYEERNIKHNVQPFFYEIGELFRNSHLVIARSGSTTIAELTALATPSILIPLPTATDNHQYENAKLLRNNNGTILLEQSNLTKERLSLLLTNLFTHDEQLFEMSKGCYSMANVDADVKIVKIINDFLKISANVDNKKIDDDDDARIKTKDAKYINDNVGLG